MNHGIHTLDNLECSGKTVLCRIDVNEPIDPTTGRLLSKTRLAACVPTIRELAEKGARVVLLSHQGSDYQYDQMHTMAEHAAYLGEMLQRPVVFVDDICGPFARDSIRNMQDGDVLFLENVRYLAEEQPLFEQYVALSPAEQADTWLVRNLAPLADLFVCDAFAAVHRSQASLTGFPQVLPSAIGRQFEKELQALTHLTQYPERPCVFLLGGEKLELALQLMQAVLRTGIADQILVGGVLGFLLLWAEGYEIGQPTEKMIREMAGTGVLDTASNLLETYPSKIVLPTDCAYLWGDKRRESMLHALPTYVQAADIGSGTAELFARILLQAKTVFATGPMGVFENPETALGTRLVWDALGDTRAYTFLSGADTIAATERYKKIEKIDYISTGNAALIRYLSDAELPVIQALRHSADKYGH